MDTAKENEGEVKIQPGLPVKITRDAKKQILIIVVAGLLLLAGVWIWKSVQLTNFKNKAATAQRQIKEAASSQIIQSHEMHLKLLAKPFVWAVRTEMLNNNMGQVNLYANDMVKEKNFQKIVVANDKGLVLLSTNKREEGKEFSSVGNPVYLLAGNTMVDTINDTLMVMSSPIMGFNSRLSTLIITYGFQQPVFP